MTRDIVIRDDTYPYRRLLGAISLEAVDDALDLKRHTGRKQRLDALELLRDEHVQHLYDASLSPQGGLSLPPHVWGAFGGGPEGGPSTLPSVAGQALGVNYATVLHQELLFERNMESGQATSHRSPGLLRVLRRLAYEVYSGAGASSFQWELPEES
jgi:hypothetical protein